MRIRCDHFGKHYTEGEEEAVMIALHSYKGGTGKTLLSINMATMLAKMGKKVCLLDLDLRAPSIYSIFKNDSNHWMNDYLSKACKIENVLSDCTSKDMNEGKLFVGLANPAIEAIRDMESKDRKWEMAALARLLALKTSLLKEMRFDYVFFDTSPGLQYSSINAIVSADTVLVVMSPDKSDLEGTQRMMHDLYDLFEKKTGIIINKIPLECFSAENPNNSITLAAHHLPVVGVVPCFCDVLAAGGKCLFASEKPDHPFTKTLQEIISNLGIVMNYANATPKPDKLDTVTINYDVYESLSETPNV